MEDTLNSLLESTRIYKNLAKSNYRKIRETLRLLSQGQQHTYDALVTLKTTAEKLIDEQNGLRAQATKLKTKLGKCSGNQTLVLKKELARVQKRQKDVFFELQMINKKNEGISATEGSAVDQMTTERLCKAYSLLQLVSKIEELQTQFSNLEQVLEQVSPETIHAYQRLAESLTKQCVKLEEQMQARVVDSSSQPEESVSESDSSSESNLPEPPLVKKVRIETPAAKPEVDGDVLVAPTLRQQQPAQPQSPEPESDEEYDVSKHSKMTSILEQEEVQRIKWETLPRDVVQKYIEKFQDYMDSYLDRSDPSEFINVAPVHWIIEFAKKKKYLYDVNRLKETLVKIMELTGFYLHKRVTGRKGKYC